MCLIPDQFEARILTDRPGVRRGIPEGGKAPAGKAAPKGATGTKPPAKAVPNKPAGKHICGFVAASQRELPPDRNCQPQGGWP